MSNLSTANNGTNPSSLLDHKDPSVWRILKYLIYLGFIAIIIVSIGSVLVNIETRVRSLDVLKSIGTALLISGACFSAGALMGFLFAIPKLLQNTSLLPDSIQSNQTVILHNDNLVQISDWLTKIIVGVGLTQLTNIPSFIKKAGTELSASFSSGDQSAQVGRNVAIGCILYFTIVGFLAAYIWTRLYFVKLLHKTDEDLRTLQEVKKEAETLKEQVSSEKSKENIEKNELASDTASLTLLGEKSSEDIRGKLDLLKQKVQETLPVKPVTVPDDLQKNRWGGKKENNGKKIDATVAQSSIAGFYDIKVKISAFGSVLQDPVAVFVHDSFRFVNDTLYVTPDENGVACVKLTAYEAFTVGALFVDGTELELDLNEQAGYPQGFYWKKAADTK
ncbi:MAG: pYEATS domain-containing protein [Chitinophagaceae bacterium]